MKYSRDRANCALDPISASGGSVAYAYGVRSERVGEGPNGSVDRRVAGSGHRVYNEVVNVSPATSFTIVLSSTIRSLGILISTTED